MTYRRPERVAYVTVPPTETRPTVLYLMALPDGPPLRFDGTAALIWLLAAEGEPDVVAALAEIVGEPVETVGPSTRAYLDDLVSQGLLARD